MKRRLAAALVAFAMPAFGEGITGISYTPDKPHPDMTWEQLRRRAWIDFPTVLFPDGAEYRVDGLCVDGEWLRSARRAATPVCRPHGEAGCFVTGMIELKVALSAPVEACADSGGALHKVADADGRPGLASACGERRPTPAAAMLDREVDVYSSPFGRWLFRKRHVIPPCR